MAIANLALRFLLELSGFVGAGYIGYSLSDGAAGGLRWLLAVVAGIAFIGLWALVAAPRRQNGLSQAQKDVIGSILLLLIALGAGLLGLPELAIGFGVLVVLNAVLLLVFGQGARQRFDAR